jgi:hypothetical protein
MRTGVRRECTAASWLSGSLPHAGMRRVVSWPPESRPRHGQAHQPQRADDACGVADDRVDAFGVAGEQPHQRDFSRLCLYSLAARRSWRMTIETTRREVQDYLRTSYDCALYIQAAIEEVRNDPVFIVKALREVARACRRPSNAQDKGLQSASPSSDHNGNRC